MDWPSMSPDLNPIEQSVGHPQTERWSTLRKERTPVATCEALVNSVPKRVKAVLENNGGHTNTFTLYTKY